MPNDLSLAPVRYRDTRDTSAEILRIVLQQMGRHDAALHPVTYTVWYEYASGANPALSRAMDAILAENRKVTDEDIARLHARHVIQRNEDAARKVEADLRRIMADVLGQAGIAGREATRYGQSLSDNARQLQAGADDGSAALVIQSLLEQTLAMQGSVASLQANLERSSREVEELKQALQRAEVEVVLDPLTGVRNRRGLERKVDELLGASDGGDAAFALLMVDIDHFKRVNDTYGHLFGDRVLRCVAQALQSIVKGRDTVARYGGEEFAVLLPETPLAGARTVGENIRATIEKSRIRRLDNNEDVGGITISVGVATRRQDEKLEQVVARADTALYQSKKNGRNRVTVDGGVA